MAVIIAKGLRLGHMLCVCNAILALAHVASLKMLQEYLFYNSDWNLNCYFLKDIISKDWDKILQFEINEYIIRSMRHLCTCVHLVFPA